MSVTEFRNIHSGFYDTASLPQALANLKKSEKEKEFFQEGYLEELEKREAAEGK